MGGTVSRIECCVDPFVDRQTQCPRWCCGYLLNWVDRSDKSHFSSYVFDQNSRSRAVSRRSFLGPPGQYCDVLLTHRLFSHISIISVGEWCLEPAAVCRFVPLMHLTNIDASQCGFHHSLWSPSGGCSGRIDVLIGSVSAFRDVV